MGGAVGRTAPQAALHSRSTPGAMPDSTVRVAVTGAAGQIGYALLFRIASGPLFGPDTQVVLQLLELEAALPALDGVRMELEDCAFPLLDGDRLHRRHRRRPSAARTGRCSSAPCRAGGDGAQGPARASTAASSPARARRSRRNAADDCRVLVVGNPCNTNALIGSTAAARHGMPQRPLVRDDHARREPRPVAAGARRPACRSARCATWPSGATTRRPSSPTAWHATHRRPAGARGHRRRGLAARRVHHQRPAARRGDHQGPRPELGGQRRERGDRHRS